MTKLLRSHLCLMILLLGGYGQSSAHEVIPSDSCPSSESLLYIELTTGVEQDSFNSLPPEELRHIFKIHATEVREEEEEGHEEITCKKKLDGGNFLTLVRSSYIDECSRSLDEDAKSFVAGLPNTTTSRRYLIFRVFRI